MFFKKFKFSIYINSFLIILSFIIPICSLALDKDSVYVWSNNSISVPTNNNQIETQSPTTTSR